MPKALWASPRSTACRWARDQVSSTRASCSICWPRTRDIEHLFYHDCGLKGLSGISNDVRDLLVSVDPRAKLALDYFVYRISLFTGMLAAAMNGIDGFVFTAGVGENAPLIREAVARRLAWLGLDIDVDGEREAPRIGGGIPGFLPSVRCV